MKKVPFLGTLKRLFKSSDEFMKHKQLADECRIAHSVAYLEVAYVRALRQSGLGDRQIVTFISHRYYKMLEELL